MSVFIPVHIDTETDKVLLNLLQICTAVRCKENSTMIRMADGNKYLVTEPEYEKFYMIMRDS